MWVPGSVYKALPVIYVAAGIGLMAAFGLDGIATISALMLFAAAGITVFWRIQHRDTPPPVDKAKQAWQERRARRIDSMPQ